MSWSVCLALLACALSSLLLPDAARAAEASAPAPAPEPAPDEASAPPATDAAAAATAPRRAQWEGAIGALLSYAPDYQGASGRRASLTPGFFLRYGRLTITNAGGFVTRRADDVQRGLDLDLSRGDRWRVNAGLRFDRGRQEDSSPALQGLGDIDPTLRVRLNFSWRLDAEWRVAGGWSLDALGHGGGHLGEVALQRTHRLSADSALNFSVLLALAGQRYLQSYFGITPAQSAATGYPVYTPRAGARDVSVSFGGRTELSRDWVAIGSISATRLLDAAAASPLTKNPNGWGLNGGIAWRF